MAFRVKKRPNALQALVAGMGQGFGAGMQAGAKSYQEKMMEDLLNKSDKVKKFQTTRTSTINDLKGRIGSIADPIIKREFQAIIGRMYNAPDAESLSQHLNAFNDYWGVKSEQLGVELYYKPEPLVQSREETGQTEEGQKFRSLLESHIGRTDYSPEVKKQLEAFKRKIDSLPVGQIASWEGYKDELESIVTPEGESFSDYKSGRIKGLLSRLKNIKDEDIKNDLTNKIDKLHNITDIDDFIDSYVGIFNDFGKLDKSAFKVKPKGMTLSRKDNIKEGEWRKSIKTLRALRDKKSTIVIDGEVIDLSALFGDKTFDDKAETDLKIVENKYKDKFPQLY